MSDDPVAVILERAADLLDQPGAWTQGFFARDSKGHTCMPELDIACSWCGEGAVAKIVGGTNRTWLELLPALDRVVGIQFSRWQDSPQRTQQEVVAALRMAATTARKDTP